MLKAKITSSKNFNKKAPAEETSPKTSPQKKRHKNTKAPSYAWDFFKKDKTRQQSTLAQQRGRTTIDGRRLNERVRYGNVCFPSPMITGNSKCAHKLPDIHRTT